MRWRALCLILLTVSAAPTAARAATGNISTFVSGLGVPVEIEPVADGSFLIADQVGRVYRAAADGSLTVVAGNGTAGFSGDGGPATEAQLNAPSGVLQLADGTILIADINNNRVRAVAPDGTISTVVGDGTPAFSGDGGPASAAQVNFPYDLAALPDGGYLIVDQDNARIRRVGPDGIISTVAGGGGAGLGDGGTATSAQLTNDVSGVAVTSSGFLIADTGGNRIRRVSDGIITTAAGTGTAGYTGDGVDATTTPINGPQRVATTADGGFVFSDWHNNRVRKVRPDGVVVTLAGDGTAATTGDGGPATQAQLNGPFGLAFDVEGDLLITEIGGKVVRKIDLGDPPPPPSASPTPTAAPQRVVSAPAAAKAIVLGGGAAAVPSTALVKALEQAPLQQALAEPPAQSQVARLAAQAAKGRSPDPALALRMDTLRYGVPITLPASPVPAVYDVAAAIAVQTRVGDQLRTTVTTLPPAAIPAKVGTGKTVGVIPIDPASYPSIGAKDAVSAAVGLEVLTANLQETQMSFNLQYLQLQSQMQSENRSYTAVSNIMKTKHDTLKNSISNIRSATISAKKSPSLKTLRRRTDRASRALRRAANAGAKILAPIVKADRRRTTRVARAFKPCPKRCQYPIG